jgi:adenylate cyclase
MNIDNKNYSRKLAAIMFTDMVDYSKISQADEALALELLEEHRKILRDIFSKYCGFEIETIGDAFFVEFESALEAVKCAIEIQERLHQRNRTVLKNSQFKIRIGIHLGDVVHKEKNVLGDGVNIAARIEPLAESEGICISQDVARQVQNKIEQKLIKLAPQKLKNIKLPVDVYAVQLPWTKKLVSAKSKIAIIINSQNKSSLIYGIASLLVILVAIALYVIFQNIPSSELDNSIAVLPFTNMSENMENEYFSDGITEDVITQLAKISDLRVISRTSVMQYKNTEKSLREIAKELKVNTILEGSVRREGNRIRVVAQLIDASADVHIWANTYDKESAEIFTIQTDVAENIAKELRAEISQREKTRIERKATENMEAYDLYLKGRYYWNKMMPNDLETSVEYFKQAIDLDPEYAIAHVGLADAYNVLGSFNVFHPSETYPKAKSAALKAIRLDENLGAAHNSLGLAIMYTDWDWDGAEKEFKKAIELNRGYAFCYVWYGLYLTVMGRFDEATRISNQATKLDPFSQVIMANKGLESYFKREYDIAIEQNLKILELNPLFHAAYVTLGGAYIQKAMYQDAITTFSKASMFSKGHPIPVAGLGYAYAISGRKEDALMMLELLLERTAEEYVSPYWIAVLYSGLENNDEAFKWLENGYEEKDGNMVYLKVMPILDNLRSDYRFISLLKKMKLSN